MASLEDGNSEPVGCPDTVQEMMDDFMVRGTNCPMQRVLNLRARCLRYNKQRTAEGVVDWVGDKILLKGISFSMGQLRKMVGDLIGRTRRMLVEELLMLAGDGNGKTRLADGGRQIPGWVGL
jgi:hypothetical protein